MNKANVEIRMLIGQNMLKYWQVADEIGINDATFSRWLRTPLNDERKERVEKAIQRLIQKVGD